MLEDVRKAVVLLPRRLRWHWAGLVPLAVLTAALEALGAGAIFVFLRLLADPAGFTDTAPGGPLLERLPSVSERSMLVAVGGGLIAFYVVRNGVLSAAAYFRDWLVQRSITEVSTRLFRAYLRTSYAFHLGRNTAALI